MSSRPRACRKEPVGIEILPFEFSNNGEGFKKFWDRICQTLAAHHLEEVVVGFEPTGPYAEPLVHYLMKRSVRIVQVNPMHTKRLRDLQGNSPGKTDRKDPRVIADIISLGHALNVGGKSGSIFILENIGFRRTTIHPFNPY